MTHPGLKFHLPHVAGTGPHNDHHLAYYLTLLVRDSIVLPSVFRRDQDWDNQASGRRRNRSLLSLLLPCEPQGA